MLHEGTPPAVEAISRTSDENPPGTSQALPSFPRRRTYDHVLAVTLKSHGVTEFYTRNVADFRTAGFADVINPID